MTACRQYKFEESPDYEKLKKLFRDLFFRCGFEHEFIFDWTIQRYRPEKAATSSNDGADEVKSKYYKNKCHLETSTNQDSMRNHQVS